MLCMSHDTGACMHTTHNRHTIHNTPDTYSPPRSAAQDTQHGMYHISSKNSGAQSQWPTLFRCLPTHTTQVFRCLPTHTTQDTPHDIYQMSSQTKLQPLHTYPRKSQTTQHTTHRSQTTQHTTHNVHTTCKTQHK